jgi:hypothetical protein
VRTRICEASLLHVGGIELDFAVVGVSEVKPEGWMSSLVPWIERSGRGAPGGGLWEDIGSLSNSEDKSSS